MYNKKELEQRGAIIQRVNNQINQGQSLDPQDAFQLLLHIGELESALNDLALAVTDVAERPGNRSLYQRQQNLIIETKRAWELLSMGGS